MNALIKALEQDLADTEQLLADAEEYYFHACPSANLDNALRNLTRCAEAHEAAHSALESALTEEG